MFAIARPTTLFENFAVDRGINPSVPSAWITQIFQESIATANRPDIVGSRLTVYFRDAVGHGHDPRVVCIIGGGSTRPVKIGLNANEWVAGRQYRIVSAIINKAIKLLKI